MDDQAMALIFKALGDKNRLAILRRLREGELCANALLNAVQIGQSTLSHHMCVLCESRLVHARRDGKWTRYSLNTELMAAIRDFTDEMAG